MSVGLSVASTCTALSSYSASSSVASTTSSRWRSAAYRESAAVTSAFIAADSHQCASRVATRQHRGAGLWQFFEGYLGSGDALQMSGSQVAGDALPDQQALVT